MNKRFAGSTIQAMYAEQSGKCHYCAKHMTFHLGEIIEQDSVTIDHKIPKSKGGKSTVENKVLACGKCNGEKDSLTDKEFILVLEYRKNPEKFEKFFQQEMR